MANGTRSCGTGCLILPRTILTVGHCVHSEIDGGWVKSIEVIPGMSAQLRPYGSAVSQELYGVSGWVNGGAVTDDYGCIISPNSARLGEQTGWFGFAALPDAELTNLLANNSGYPGDKAFGTQWYNAGRIVGVEPKRLVYMIDTAPGQSGSPAWRYSQALLKTPCGRDPQLRRMCQPLDPGHARSFSHLKIRESPWRLKVNGVGTVYRVALNRAQPPAQSLS
jgi:V8-like Glu-specific endopeptidase